MDSFQFPKPPVGLEFSVSDHVARSEFFLANAENCDEIAVSNWLLMASVYSARAPIEIVLTEWDTVYKRGDTTEFREDAEKRIRHFSLIATLRVHDFHRGAIHLKPNSNAIYGPINMRTGNQSNSIVGISIEQETARIKETKIRNAHISYDRPVQTNGLNVFDFSINEYVLLTTALREYLEDLKVYLYALFPSIKWG